MLLTGSGHLELQAVTAGLLGLELRRQGLGPADIGDALHQILYPALGLTELTLKSRQFAVGVLGPRLLEALSDGGGEPLHALRRCEQLLNGAQQAGYDLLLGNRGTVAADGITTGVVCGAAELGIADAVLHLLPRDPHGVPADAAAKKTCEEVAVLAGTVGPTLTRLWTPPSPALHCIPEFTLDDGKLGNIPDDVLMLGPHHAASALLAGALHPFRLIPDPVADVPLVAEDVANGGVGPAVAVALGAVSTIVRGGNTLLVQQRRDGLAALAFGVESEDAADDLSLFGVDDDAGTGSIRVLRVLLWLGAVAVHPAAGGESHHGTAFKASVGLLPDALQELVVHQGHGAKGQSGTNSV